MCGPAEVAHFLPLISTVESEHEMVKGFDLTMVSSSICIGRSMKSSQQESRSRFVVMQCMVLGVWFLLYEEKMLLFEEQMKLCSRSSGSMQILCG